MYEIRSKTSHHWNHSNSGTSFWESFVLKTNIKEVFDHIQILDNGLVFSKFLMFWHTHTSNPENDIFLIYTKSYRY